MAVSIMKKVSVAVRRVLAERGYGGSGTTFVRRGDDGNTLIVELQKGSKSTPTAAVLTINYGVYSARVGRCLDEDSAAARDVARAHWRSRIDEDGRERWLTISVAASEVDIETELRPVLAEVDADLQSHRSDVELRDAWLTGHGGGLTRMQRLIYLSCLVKQIGPADRLDEVVGELRAYVEGRPQAAIVRHQLARIGIAL